MSSGSCTLAAERMAARLKAAGIADTQLTLFAAPGNPKEGGLVAIYPGTSKTAKPILLVAHIDVVEAKRADWERDPFVMVEGNGYFYGRGTADDKAQAAVWVDTLIRFQQAGYKPRAHGQGRADLRRGNQRRVQRGRVARREQARPDRRRTSP